MQIYRRLSPINALSFDLDDTLYGNYPIMVEADKAMRAFFDEHLPAFGENSPYQAYDISYWFAFRNQAIAAEPMLKHDVVAVRIEAYYRGIKALGFTKQQARALAEKAMAHFEFHRSNFTVPESVHQLLSDLKQHFTLIAISNGNVDTKIIGIDGYFDHIYHAQKGLKQKPATDMFTLAKQAVALPAEQILHIGDCGNADIFGALASGYQSAYLDKYGIGKPLKLMPHIGLTDIEQLRTLIP